MRINVIGSSTATAIDNIMRPLAWQLQKHGHDIRYYRMPRPGLNECDFLHFGWWRLIHAVLLKSKEETGGVRPTVPFTAHLHHLEAAKEAQFVEAQPLLKEAGCLGYIVSDSYWKQRLGALGITNAWQIPQAFDHSRFHPLPLPEEFTVGWLGTNYPYKRFDTARLAVQLAGVASVDNGRRDLLEKGSPEWLGSALDFHRRISAYIVTTFTDTGPLPPQEAMLCGRPVITTTMGMMRDLVAHKVNGYVFDGSVEDLAVAIHWVRDHLTELHENVLATTLLRLPALAAVTRQYEDLFQRLLSRVEVPA